MDLNEEHIMIQEILKRKGSIVFKMDIFRFGLSEIHLGLTADTIGPGSQMMKRYIGSCISIRMILTMTRVWNDSSYNKSIYWKPLIRDNDWI